MKNKLLLLLVLIVPIITFGQETAKKGLDERINDWFEPITAKWEGIVFWLVPGTGVPLVVFLLVILLFINVLFRTLFLPKEQNTY